MFFILIIDLVETFMKSYEVACWNGSYV